MKKIILLLTFPFVLLMADFTLNGAQLTLVGESDSNENIPNNPTIATGTSTSSVYEKQVTLPECDVNNPEVQFIKSNADWSHINDTNKRIFCVSPGNYVGLGKIEITSDGTGGKPRFIILNNGNDTHPAKLPDNQLANVRFKLNGANHWVIDRMSLQHLDVGWKMWEFTGGSSDNIINRAYFNDTCLMIYFSGNCNRNTIQNSAFYDMTVQGLTSDHPALNFNGTAEDSIIVNNEFRNTNDSVQFTGAKTTFTAEGSIIDNNIMWIDSSLYVDINGNPTSTGQYSLGENAIDLKVGSMNSSKPIIISNNIMFGFKQGSDGDDFGAAIVGHYNAQNIHVKNNIIFDANQGIGTDDGGEYEPLGAQKWIVDGNTFVGLGSSTIWAQNHSITIHTATVQFRLSHDMVFKNNYIIEGKYRSILLGSDDENIALIDNTYIEAQPNVIPNGTATVSGNIVYNSNAQLSNGTNRVILTEEPTALINIPYNLYANNPKVKSIRVVVGSPAYTRYH